MDNPNTINITRSKIAVALLEMCNKKNVSYCVLRDYENLPESIDHDLDLAVLPKDLNVFENTLDELLDIYGLNAIRLDKRIDFFSYALVIDPTYEGILKVDVWTDFRWRGMKWLDIEAVLSNTSEWKGLKIANPAMGSLIRVLKELIYTGNIPERARSRVVNEIGHSVEEVARIARSYLPDKTISELISAIQDQDWDKLSRVSRTVRWVLLKRYIKINSIMISNLISGCISFGYSIQKKLIWPYGKLVVLVGPDGSGKTTLSSTIQKDLYRQLFVKTHYVYSRFRILPDLKTIFSRSLVNKYGGDTIVRTRNSHGLIRGSIMVSYYSLDYILSCYKVAYWKMRGHLVIADRYFYDYYFQPQWENIPGILLRLMEYLVPEPDIVLFLFCPPEDIYCRKPELEIEDIELQQDKIKKLMPRLKMAVEINTGKGESFSSREANSVIISTMPPFRKKRRSFKK